MHNLRLTQDLCFRRGKLDTQNSTYGIIIRGDDTKEALEGAWLGW